MKKIVTLALGSALLYAQVFNVSTSKEFSDALYDAANNAKDDTIILSSGRYYTSDFVQFQYLVDKTNNRNSLTIQASSGLTKDSVILDGNNTSRVLTLINSDHSSSSENYGDITIKDITITNGYSPTKAGGIYEEGFDLYLYNLDIVYNKANGMAGGVYHNGYEQRFEIYDSNLSYNEATEYNNYVGAVYGDTRLGSKIQNSVISYNKGNYAGGTYNIGEINNCIYDSNKGTRTFEDQATGGAVGAKIIKDSTFINNYAKGAGALGYFSGSIDNVIFKNNRASYVGAVSYSYYNDVNITNSQFLGNRGGIATVGTRRLGGADDGYVNIDKTKFLNNETTGSAIVYLYYGVLSNCEFLNNFGNGGNIVRVEDADIVNNVLKHNLINNGYIVNIQSSNLINNTFIDNNSSSTIKGYGKLINNIIYETNRGNNEKDILVTNDLEMYNNYVDLSYVDNPDSYMITEKKSIEPDASDDYLDTDTFKLKESSYLIDKGLNPTESFFTALYSANTKRNNTIKTILKKDKIGNMRISGDGVDLGAYEYGSSDTVPVINSITIVGDKKQYSKIDLNVSYTLYKGRSIDTISYNFKNKDEIDSSHIYDTPGVYSIKVVVTDNTGEYTSSNISVNIVPLPFDEMTKEQKFKEAIEPEYYDAIMALIIDDKKDVNQSAIEYVIQHPSEFSLIKESKVILNSSDIDALPSGWSLTSTPLDITDMSIFANVKMVWTYNNGQWSAYSPDASVAKKIADDKSVSALTTIPAKSGIWIEK